MGKFKMQFVHPSTESEFIEWLNSPVNSICNTDPVFKAAIEQIQNANIKQKLNGVDFEKAIKKFPVFDKSYADKLKESLDKLSSDLSVFEGNNSSHTIIESDITTSIGAENETLISMSNYLHDSVINGIYAYVKRRIWRRKMKLINNRYEKRN